MANQKVKLTKENKKVIADALAGWFFAFWQKQANLRVDEKVVLRVGSQREGYPANKATS